MQHKHRMVGRYVEAFSWHSSIDDFLARVVVERPLLHVCSGPMSKFGDIRVDLHVRPIAPGVMADWTSLPFAANSFGAVFSDPPWNVGYMKQCADFCKEALRLAPVIYVMSPWLWVHKGVQRKCWIREFPGVNVPIILARYSAQGGLL